MIALFQPAKHNFKWSSKGGIEFIRLKSIFCTKANFFLYSSPSLIGTYGGEQCIGYRNFKWVPWENLEICAWSGKLLIRLIVVLTNQ